MSKANLPADVVQAIESARQEMRTERDNPDAGAYSEHLPLRWDDGVNGANLVTPAGTVLATIRIVPKFHPPLYFWKMAQLDYKRPPHGNEFDIDEAKSEAMKALGRFWGRHTGRNRSRRRAAAAT